MANPAQAAIARAQARFAGATVVERGRRSLKFSHPGEPNKFTFVTSSGPYHLRNSTTEIDTAFIDAVSPADDPWQKKMVGADFHVYAFREATLSFDQGQLVEYRHPPSGSVINFEPTQLQWTNDLGQLEPIADPQNVAASIVDDRLDFVGAYGAGIDFQWWAQSAQLKKLLTLQSAPPAPTLGSLVGAALKLTFIFQKSNGVSIWVDGVEWNERANNPVETTAPVEFRDVSNNVLWEFRPGWAGDSGVDVDGAPTKHITPTTRFRKQGNSLFVDILTPWSWLEAATYPVFIDPTTTDRVGASAEDAHEDRDNTDFTSTDTKLDSTSNTSGKETIAGMWFDVSAGPSSGDTIDNATVDVDTDLTPLRDDPEITIWCEDVDTAVNFSTTADVEDRVTTTAGTTWSASNIGAGIRTSADFGGASSPMQEVADRAGWTGVVVVLFGGGTGANKSLQFQSYDGSTSTAPELSVTYTTGSTTHNPTATSDGSIAITTAQGNVKRYPTGQADGSINVTTAQGNTKRYVTAQADGSIGVTTAQGDVLKRPTATSDGSIAITTAQGSTKRYPTGQADGSIAITTAQGTVTGAHNPTATADGSIAITTAQGNVKRYPTGQTDGSIAITTAQGNAKRYPTGQADGSIAITTAQGAATKRPAATSDGSISVTTAQGAVTKRPTATSDGSISVTTAQGNVTRYPTGQVDGSIAITTAQGTVTGGATTHNPTATVNGSISITTAWAAPISPSYSGLLVAEDRTFEVEGEDRTFEVLSERQVFPADDGPLTWSTVAVPSGFTLTPPFAIQQQGNRFRVDPDFSIQTQAGITVTTTYYVDGTSGNDGNSGADWDNAFKTPAQAFGQSDVDRIYVRNGTWTRNELIIGFTRSIELIGDGTATFAGTVNDEITVDWAASGNHYDATLAGTSNLISKVYDFGDLDANGHPRALLPLGSEGAVDAQAGSFYWDSTGKVIHVRTYDDRAPDDDLKLIHSVTFTPQADNLTFYVENVTFWGTVRHRNSTSAGGHKAYYKDCTVYGTVNVNGIDEFMMFGCNLWVCPFSTDNIQYNIRNTVITNAYEYMCNMGYGGGDFADQASTTHDGSKTVRISGWYHDTSASVLSDATGAETWNLGIRISDAGNNIGISGGTASVWLDYCRITGGVSTYDLQNAAGGTIYTRAFSGFAGADDINGTLSNY